MPLPGTSAESELKPLLKKLLSDKDEVYKFAVAASGPRDGQLILDKKVKLKKAEVQKEAEAEAKENSGKAVKMDVMTGECRLDATNAATLRLVVYGKAPAKAVACLEHLLVRGPFKAIGFTGVILEEVDEVAAAASPNTETLPESETPESETPESETADPLAAKWELARAAAEPVLLRVLSAGRGDLTKLRGAWVMAQGKAEAADFKTALQIVARLLPLLKEADADGGSTGTAVAPTNRFVNHAKARLAWQATRQKLSIDLKTLEQAILDHYRDEPDLSDLASKVRKFDTVLENLDTVLIDTLDDALNAADTDQRAAFHEQAREALERYRSYVESEPLLPALDDNPFVPLTTHKTLLKTLQVLDASLA